MTALVCRNWRSVSIVALCGFAHCAAAMTVTVTNPTEDDWPEAPVVVSVQPAMNVKSVEEGGKRSGIQIDDLDGDGKPDEIVFLAALKPHETKTFKLSTEAPETTLPKRAHAGMYL